VQHSIAAGDPNVLDVAALLAASETHAYRLYPPESVHMLDVRDLIGPSVRFLVARTVAGVAEGCGAIVIGSDDFAEIKRMYVVPEARGKGIGSMILRRLEAEAREAGVRVIRLETGPLQPEAIGLYRRFGYRDRGPFGAYKLDPLSLFMEKKLGADPASPPNLL
jgi:putative acetyltransferase